MATFIALDTERRGEGRIAAVERHRRDTADSGVVALSRFLISAMMWRVAVLGEAAATATAPSRVTVIVLLQKLSHRIWKLARAAYRKKGNVGARRAASVFSSY